MGDITWAAAAAAATVLETLGHTIEVGDVTTPDPDVTYPYLVIWVNPAERAPTSLNGAAMQTTVPLTVTAVGRDPRETATTADRAADLLAGARLVIAGYTTALATQVTGSATVRAAPERDPATGRPVYIAPSVWQVQALPA